MAEAEKEMFDTALQLLVRGASAEEVNRVFADNVRGWSPIVNVASANELHKVLADRINALDKIDYSIDEFDVVGNKLIAEWRLAADHTGVLWVGAYRFEPTYRRLALAGASFFEVRDDEVVAFRNYFDDAALLEQLFTADAEN